MAQDNESEDAGIARRRFLQLAGIGVAGAGLVPFIAACSSSKKASPAASSAATSAPASTPAAAPATSAAPTAAASSAVASAPASSAPASSAAASAAPTLDSVKSYLGFAALPAATLGAGKTIKMTTQVPLTGTFAYYGGVFSNGLKLAIKHIAAMGGPTIDMTYQDAKSPDPQTVISGVREIESKGVQFMISSVGGNFGAILPTVAAAKNLVCLNTNMAFGVAPYTGVKNYWETDGDISLCLPFVGTYLSSALKGKSKFALVTSDQGAQANDVLVKSIKGALPSGWTLSDSEFVPAGTNDYTTVVSHIGAGNPDAVACALGSGAFGQFVKAYRQAGLTGKILVYGSPPSIDDFTAVGGVLAGVVYLGPLFNISNPGNPWGDFFLSEYNAAYGTKPGLPDIYATCFYVNLFTWWQIWQTSWAAGKDPTAASVNAYLATGPTLKTLLGGNATTVGTTTVNPKTHFAVMYQGAYEIQSDFAFKQFATSTANGTGYIPIT